MGSQDLPRILRAARREDGRRAVRHPCGFQQQFEEKEKSAQELGQSSKDNSGQKQDNDGKMEVEEEAVSRKTVGSAQEGDIETSRIKFGSWGNNKYMDEDLKRTANRVLATRAGAN